MDIQELSTGIDIVEIDRIARIIANYGDRFLKKVFTQAEIEYCRAKPKPAQHFAARFAAKEAVYKAICGQEHPWFNQIEVLRDPSGQPKIRFDTTINLSGDNFRVSISHSREFAAAIAIAIPRK